MSQNSRYHYHFYDDYSFFINKVSQLRIGFAKDSKGLYFMIQPKEKSAMSYLLLQTNGQIMSLHKELGYPSFHLIHKIFPNQIKGNLEKLKSEIFELEKYKRTTSLPSTNISSHQFRLVHCDL